MANNGTVMDEKDKRVIVEIPAALFWDYKLALAKKRQSSAEVLRECIEQYVKEAKEDATTI